MTTTGDGKAIEALSANALTTRFENLDQATVESSKDRIIDIIGCAIGGANAPGCPGLVKLVREWGGKKEATVIAHGFKAPALNAAMVNGITDRSFDFEVMAGSVAGKGYGQHVSGTTVPTALAMSEMMGVDGKELITALVVGDDTANRVALSYDFDFFGGFDGTMTHPNFGATAIAGRLLGLNTNQMKKAFGIVVNTIAGSFSSIWDGATTFKFGQGTAARNGILAAELAKEGWTGLEDALFGTYSWYKLYTHGCTHPEMLTKDLGKIYYVENNFKRFPCGGPNHPFINLALGMRQKYNINPKDIADVSLLMGKRSLENYYAKPFQLRDNPHGDAIFSFQYTVATALLKGKVDMWNFTEEAIRDPEVNALIAKTKCVEDKEAKPGPGAMAIRIKMKDGKEFTASPEGPQGHILGKPMSRDEIIAKFMHQVDFSQTVRQKNADKIVDMVVKLEKLDDVNKLMKLCS
jgi:2-methylcitrate dehydratase PrpD